MPVFNDRLKQLLLLIIILTLTYMLFSSLSSFIPGILGAITLYILSRKIYANLVYNRKWRKGWTAGLFILFYLIVLGVPVYLVILLIGPRINNFISHPNLFIDQAKKTFEGFEAKTGFDLLTPASLNTFLGKISTVVPGLVNSTTNLLFNLAIMLFLLYYFLVSGRQMEAYLYKIAPLKKRNLAHLVSETDKIIKANALGIPVISIIQGAVATLGYFLFNVPEFLVWGVLTGLFAFFPIVGTMIIWVPMVIHLYAVGDSFNATGLMLYSFLVTGNFDTIARMTLLRTIGNSHPVITIIGVIAGLNLFGFIGLIFGPLLVSYIGLLFSIYLNEFTELNETIPETVPETTEGNKT